MKNIIIILTVFAFFACETKENYIDTGISSGIYDGNMMAYFASNSYDWDSTALIIQRAGLEEMFTGNDSEYEQITFLGPTNHSIRKWMLGGKDDNPIRYTKISDIPVDECRTMILKHVLKNKIMKKDIPFINPLLEDYEAAQDGGIDLTTIGGNVVFAFRRKTDYGGVTGAGATELQLYSRAFYQRIPLASPDIECDNGVVHSLNYNYTFGDI
jgi:hypothetical protein